MINQSELLLRVKNAWDRVYADVNAIDALPWVSTTLPESILVSFIQRIKRRNKANKDVRILDFGCGNGRIGRAIEKMCGCGVFYYDISEKALDYCEKAGTPSEYVIRDISKCKKHFDGIIVWGVFHHMDPRLWDSQLELIVNLLTPEGIILFGDFTKEDGLFARTGYRPSEVTHIDSYAVDLGFIKKRLHIIDSCDFSFPENNRFFDSTRFFDHEDPNRKVSARKMTVVTSEQYLVDQKEAIVKQKIESLKLKPEFWHFVKYSFRDSLSSPHGKAVTFFREADTSTARSLWLEGMTLFRHHDTIYKESIGDKSLSEELFIHSARKYSFYVNGKGNTDNDQVSITIERMEYKGNGQHFRICLLAPTISVQKPSEQFFEVCDFGKFLSYLKKDSELCSINCFNNDFLIAGKNELVRQLQPYSEIPLLPVLMMVLMVWPSTDFPEKSFDFIQPPVFQENLGGDTLEVSAGGLVMFSNGPLITVKDSVLSAINRWATLYTTRELVKYTRLKSVSAAIAQVMARNMSHNFGSHVLSHFIASNAYSLMSDKEVANMERYIPSEECLSPDLFSDLSKNQQLPFFMQYLKSRMDYLSEVTFGVSDLLTTKMMKADVMKELDRVRLLLNYISGIGNFKFRFNLINEIRDNEDVPVAFPNDVLGCQAFYNILENIIRNTAKHHIGNSENKETVFTVRIKGTDPQDYDLVEGADELYCVEIDDGLPKKDIKSLVSKQNERFNDSVLDENNNLRNHSLGLLEMKASAAFLRQIDLVNIVSEDYLIDIDEIDNNYHENNGLRRMNIIKAFNANGALGYRFFLQKPKEFLFVGDTWTLDGELEQNNKVIRGRLLNAGIQFLNNDVLVDAMRIGQAFAHQFMIYDQSVDTEILSRVENRTLLPLRQILVMDSQQQNNLLALLNNTSKDVNSILEELKQFAWSTLGEKKIESVVKFFSHGHLIDWLNTKDYFTCVENLGHRTLEKLPGFSKYSNIPDKKRTDKLIIYRHYAPQEIQNEVCEAYLNKVIIIDERVQSFAEKVCEEDTPCWCLFESTGVMIPRCPRTDEKGRFIPPLIPRKSGYDEVKFVEMDLHDPEVFPLDTKVFNEFTPPGLLDYIDSRIKDSFLIIHYGILERLFARDEKTINDKLNEWANNSKRVVVTSGRGAHSLNLPNTVCFANLSSVLYTCVENRNKYLINYLINQSRRKRT